MKFARLLLVLVALRLLLVLVALLPAPGTSRGEGSAEIDRTLARQPAYKSTPEYCLLVLGPAAKTRVWLVRDGDTLYVDRNGNGDLTEAGEAVPSRRRGLPGPFLVHLLTDREGGTEYTDLVVGVFLENKARDLPGYWSLEIEVNGRYVQSAFVEKLARRPRDAAVVHFGGPLRMGLAQAEKQILVHGDKPSELYVRVATECGGVERAVVGHEKGIPKDVHPVAEITFPPAAGARPTTLEVPLARRC
jgi:hypothetical protein